MAETPIRELNVPRMAAALAVGRDLGSFRLRTVRGPWGKAVLGRSSFNEGMKYSVKSLREQDGEMLHSGTEDGTPKLKGLSEKAAVGDKWGVRGAESSDG